MADNVIDSFTSLRDKGERLQALQSLVQVLNLEERNALKNAISERNDILTALPFELALHVFDYLDPLDVWRLQSVSRGWRIRLSSAEILHGALMRWKTQEHSDEAPSAPSLLDRPLESSIRHIRAFQEGRPFSWQALQLEGNVENVQLRGQHLAYRQIATQGGSVVNVHDLCAGTKETFRDEARETINDVILTDTLVGFTTYTSGIWYWKRLADVNAPMQKVQLPSASTSRADGDRDCIAIIMRRDRDDRPDSPIAEMIIFDASTLQVRSLPIPHGKPACEPSAGRLRWQVLVDVDRQCADIFYAAAPAPRTIATHIHHIRMGLDGSVLGKDVKHLGSGLSGSWWFPRPQSVGRDRVYTLGISGPSGRVMRPALFDAERGAIVEEREYLHSYPYNRTTSALWKGSVFCLASTQLLELEEREPGTFEGRRHPEDTPGLSGRYKRMSVKEFNQADHPNDKPQYLVNDTFLIVKKALNGQFQAIEIFCFDEEVQMAGGQSTGLWN